MGVCADFVPFWAVLKFKNSLAKMQARNFKFLHQIHLFSLNLQGIYKAMLLVAKVGIFKAKCDKNQPQTKQGLALSKRRYSRSSFQTEWRTPRRLWVKALVKTSILGTLTRTFHCRFALVSSFQDKTLTIFAFFKQICCIFVKRLLCYHYKSPLYHHLKNAWLSQKRFLRILIRVS